MTYLTLYGPHPSPCCSALRLIVRSREGGFVTQNCLSCGKPYSISLGELPALTCDECGSKLIAFVAANHNYAYRCPSCGNRFDLSEVVPPWHERFDEQGFGLDTD